MGYGITGTCVETWHDMHFKRLKQTHLFFVDNKRDMVYSMTRGVHRFQGRSIRAEKLSILDTGVLERFSC